MGLQAVTQTSQQLETVRAAITEADMEFVLQFAFRTGDKELTNKLIDELAEQGADKQAVYQKYGAVVFNHTEWIQRIENLLVALEMYRVQEKKAVETLSSLLSACGVDISPQQMKELSTEEVRSYAEQMLPKEQEIKR